MKVLHILPRWIGGGPERDLIELSRQDLLRGTNVQRRALILDRPLSAPLLIKARKVGLHLVNGEWRDALVDEVSAADVVEIRYWNHPLMAELLRKELPPSRIVIRSAVAGDTLPQIISAKLAAFPDLWILTSPQGYGAKNLERVPAGAHNIPALADMQRMENFTAKPHAGVRAAYLGSIDPSKLHPRFPEIVKATQGSIHFDLIGDAAPESILQLQLGLEALGVTDRVTLHGHVEDISAALAKSDLFAYPLNVRSWATSEKSLQEAMWIGLPPVVLKGTAADGWIESGTTGFLANNIMEFADSVNTLARDKSLRHQIAESAQAFARINFDPTINSERLVTLFNQMLEFPKRPRESLSSGTVEGAEIFLESIDSDSDDLKRMINIKDTLPQHERLLLLRGEGGLLHYANHYPQDSMLRSWVERMTPGS